MRSAKPCAVPHPTYEPEKITAYTLGSKNRFLDDRLQLNAEAFYWKYRNQPVNAERHARNEAMTEHDHAPLRAAITAVVRETKHKVLLCPEDMSQMEVGKQWVYDKLPDNIKKRVVWREQFWLTDEALSTYRRSAGLFGLEMHSPIMCIGNGIPAIVGRFAEQTSKGFMWRDIGLGDWLFDFDQEAEIARYVPAVLALAKNPAQAKAKIVSARKFVEQRQRQTMQVVKNELHVARRSTP